MKKTFALLLIVAVLFIGGTAVAYGAGLFQTPAEIVAGLTGKDINSVEQARQGGTTYGAQAAQAGKLDEFQQQRLAQYKLQLDDAVRQNRMTQAQADTLYNNMKLRMETCTGTGTGTGTGQCKGGGVGGQGLRNGTGGQANGRSGGFCGMRTAQ